MQKENYEYQTQLYDKINPFYEIFFFCHLGSNTSDDISIDSKTVISASKDCRAFKWDSNTKNKSFYPNSVKNLFSVCLSLQMI